MTNTHKINIYNIFIKLYPNFNECSYDRADENGELKKRWPHLYETKFKQGINVCTMQFCKIGNVDEHKTIWSKYYYYYYFFHHLSSHPPSKQKCHLYKRVHIIMYVISYYEESFTFFFSFYQRLKPVPIASLNSFIH